MFRWKGLSYGLMYVSVCAFVVPAPADALDKVIFRLAEENDELRTELRNASALQTAFEDERTSAQDLFAAALSDYGRLLDALYANGFYSPTIDILLDGRQASDIPLLSVPTQVNDVRVLIDTGPIYRFGRTEVTPLPPATEMPPDFDRNERARSGTVGDALDTAIISWRDAGYAKAELADQSVVADHARRALDVSMRIAPGPRVKFGVLRVNGNSAVRGAVIRRVAAIPTGAQFSPKILSDAEQRLRRTGAFSSISLEEGETVAPDGTMDIGANVVDAKPRRFGFGAEISTLEGVKLSSFWLHRNLFGGAERLRIDGEVSNIGAADSGMDYSLGARLEIPAVLGPDVDGFVFSEIAHLDETTYLSDRIELGLGLTRTYSESLTASAGVGFLYSETEDDLGDRTFTLITLPVSASSMSATTSSTRRAAITSMRGDALYRRERQPSPARGSPATRATTSRSSRTRAASCWPARLQLGSRHRARISTDTPPDYLFYSGGGGTVRGQPYQSLDIDLGGGDSTGGRSFVGVSAEYRTDITGNLGAVAFYDAGYVGADRFYDGPGDWHSGAGLGLRYNTGIGPIRFDVGGPGQRRYRRRRSILHRHRTGILTRLRVLPSHHPLGSSSRSPCCLSPRKKTTAAICHR